MNANGSAATDLVHRDEVYRIVGVAMEVLNSVGHGLHEKPYDNALVADFVGAGIPYNQQSRYPVRYKGVQICKYIPDLIVFGKIIVDVKVIERITDHERGQVMNYLRITKFSVGLILNFRRAKLEWERVVLSDHSR